MYNWSNIASINDILGFSPLCHSLPLIMMAQFPVMVNKVEEMVCHLGYETIDVASILDAVLIFCFLDQRQKMFML